MRHEREKHQPSLPTTISGIVLTDDIRFLSGQEFVFIEGNIVMMGKAPTINKLAE